VHKLISIFVVLVGCSAAQVDIPNSQDALDDLDLALEAWAQSELDSYRYTMVYRDSTRCAAHEYVVLVRDGQTDSSKSRRLPSSSDESNAGNCVNEVKPHFAAGMTITNLLTHIAQIDCPLHATHSREIRCPRDGATFEAHYHPQMGFPIAFRYTYGRLLDEQFGQILGEQESKYDFEYRITEFQIIE